MRETSSINLEMLLELSRFYGSKPEFVLAGGGNTSLKTEDTLYVKASGTSLASIDADGFVELDRGALHTLSERNLDRDPVKREQQFKDAIMAARIHPEKNLRPSVECVLHNLLLSRFVIHTHPTLVNAVTCCKKGEQIACEWFGEKALWISYVDPGVTLAHVLNKTIREYTHTTRRTFPPAILIQNHGLIVCGDTLDEIHSVTDHLITTIQRYLDAVAGTNSFGSLSEVDSRKSDELIESIRTILQNIPTKEESAQIALFDDSETVMNLVCGAEGKRAANEGSLTPDQIVYCNSFPLWFELPDDISSGSLTRALKNAFDEHITLHRFPPKVVLIQNLGMFTLAANEKAADSIRLVYMDAIKVMEGAHRLGGINFMNRSQYEFIEDWEAEAYRRMSRYERHLDGCPILE